MRQHVEAVIEILAQLAGGDRLAQPHIGRGDDADIDLDRLPAADPQDLALLQKAQQQALQIDRHIADLVEKQRAAMGVLDVAVLAPDGAGERAFFVPEELRGDQGRRHGGAVERHARARPPGSSGRGWLAPPALFRSRSRR